MRSDPTQQPSDPVRQFVARLSPAERVLVVLKRELYEGDWNAMEADLRARLAGRPYVFRLVHRIEDDLERIEQLRAVERLHRTNLADYVDLGPPVDAVDRQR